MSRVGSLAAVLVLLFMAVGCSGSGDGGDGVYVVAGYVPAGFRVERFDGGLRLDHSYTDAPFGVDVFDCAPDQVDVCGSLESESTILIDGREVHTFIDRSSPSHLCSCSVAYVADGTRVIVVRSVGFIEEAARVAAGLRVVDHAGWRRWVQSVGYDPAESKCCERGRLIRVSFINDSSGDRYLDYCWLPDCDERVFDYQQIVAGGRLQRELVSVPGPVGRYVVHRGGLDEDNEILGCLHVDQSARPGSSVELRLSSATPCA
jgi:hypothetical protein